MNVQYSDDIIKTIHTNRKNIYNSDRFKISFANNLMSSLDATDVQFIPEQFGGWSVCINTNSNQNSYNNYVLAIEKILFQTFREIDQSLVNNKLLSNIFNIVMTGSNSFVIKL